MDWVLVLTSRIELKIFNFQKSGKRSTIVLSVMNKRTCFSINLRTIVTKTLRVIFFFRNPSKISTNFHLKSRMYPGIQDTWHGCCSGEGSDDGYPHLCTSS
jgi:hypothetical protein